MKFIKAILNFYQSINSAYTRNFTKVTRKEQEKLSAGKGDTLKVAEKILYEGEEDNESPKNNNSPKVCSQFVIWISIFKVCTKF